MRNTRSKVNKKWRRPWSKPWGEDDYNLLELDLI